MDFINAYFPEFSGTFVAFAILISIASTFMVMKYDVLGFVCNGFRVFFGTHPPKETELKDSFNVTQNHGEQLNNETTVDKDINAPANAAFKNVGNVTLTSRFSRGNKTVIRTNVN